MANFMGAPDELRRIFIHVRWPLQLYTLLGFMFGLVMSRTLFGINVLISFASWLLLIAGITVFNSFYDRDDKPVAGLRNPPEISRSLLYGGIAFKLAALAIATLVSTFLAMLVMLGIILSILYSHSKFRAKSGKFLGLAFNFIAGFFTFVAGSGQSIILPGAISAGLFTVAVQLMTQVHQTKDDRKRGDNSYAVASGKRKTLMLSSAVLLAAGFFGMLAFYASSLLPYIPLLIIYMAGGLWLISRWLGSKNDFRMMTLTTNYFSVVGCAIFIYLYVFVV